MPKALVTGAAGFIGLQVSRRLLASGYEVHLVDNLQRGRRDDELLSTLSDGKTRFFEMDLSKADAFKDLDQDYDQVFHFAAMLGVERVLNHPFEVLQTNAVTMLNILDWARTLTSLKRFIFSSTSEIYAGTRSHYSIPIPTPENVIIALEDLQKPRTSYALSKAYGEALVHASGLPFTIYRFHNVYGPRMGFDHVIPQIIKKILSNPIVAVPSADHTRAFCYIDDAVTQIIGASTADNTLGSTLNIGDSSEEISIRELVEKIASTIKVEISIESEPATDGSPDRRCPDTTLMKQLTGLVAETGLIQGLQKTADWYLPYYRKEALA